MLRAVERSRDWLHMYLYVIYKMENSLRESQPMHIIFNAS